MPASRTSPYILKTNLARFLNTSDADYLPCAYCHKHIPLLKALLENGETIVIRDNRIDCQTDYGLESYHLSCYDLALLGRILPKTMQKIKELEKQYGQRDRV
jgi:hypothetical protein